MLTIRKIKAINLSSSLAKGLQMDLIGAVPMERDQHLKVFAQMQDKSFVEGPQSNRHLQNLTSVERKEKLLGYVNEQRKHATLEHDAV